MKKIDIWIVQLLAIGGILFAVFFGMLVRQELVGETKFGLISESALFLAEIPSNLKKMARGEGVHTGDFQVPDKWQDLSGFSGVPSLKKQFLLLSRYDGDLQQSVVELVDLMNFEIKYRWNPDFDVFNSAIDQRDEFAFLDRDANDTRAVMIHPMLTSDGGLLFTGERTPLRFIDKCSQLAFQVEEDIFHHSVEIDSVGTYWVPSHLFPQSLSADLVGRQIPTHGGFYDDAIVRLDEEGQILFQKSVSQIFIENGLTNRIFGQSTFQRDPLHLNDIQPALEDGPYWRKGDLFLSIRNQSMIVLYRPETNKIIWSKAGPWSHQHDVNIINDHVISVFDNNVFPTVNGRQVQGSNRMVLYDFSTNSVRFFMEKAMKEHEISTTTAGRGRVLSDEELFVEDQNSGRLVFFENDRIKWQYVNRSSTGEVYTVSWSRLVDSDRDLKIIKELVSDTEICQ